MIVENTGAPPSLFELAERAVAMADAKAKADGTNKSQPREKEPSGMGMRSKTPFRDTGRKPWMEPGDSDSDVPRFDETTASPEGEEAEPSPRYEWLRPYIAKDSGSLEIPVGWLDHAEKAFKAFAESGLKLAVKAFAQEDGALTVVASEPGKGSYYRSSSQMGERLLNSLLRGTLELCPLCGSRVEPKAAPEADDGDGFSISREITGSFAVCRDCLTKHGLSEPEDAGEAR